MKLKNMKWKLLMAAGYVFIPASARRSGIGGIPADTVDQACSPLQPGAKNTRKVALHNKG